MKKGTKNLQNKDPLHPSAQGAYHARFRFFWGNQGNNPGRFRTGTQGPYVFCNCVFFFWFARLEFSTQFVAQDVFDCHLCCSCFLLLLGVVVVVVAVVVIKVVVIVVVVVFVGRRCSYFQIVNCPT